MIGATNGKSPIWIQLFKQSPFSFCFQVFYLHEPIIGAIFQSSQMALFWKVSVNEKKPVIIVYCFRWTVLWARSAYSVSTIMGQENDKTD